MIKAKYLNLNEFVLFCTIVEEKYEPGKSLLRGITDRVSKTYAEYLTSFHGLQSKSRSDFAPNETTQKNALRLCYSSATEIFEHIKERIFNSQCDDLKSLCPYCLLDRPKTLDHYIGGADFPEYSILCKNLIPCCGECNNKKNENWRARKLRRFIHYYIDDFFDEKFLVAKLIFPKNGNNAPAIEFSLKRPVSMTAADFRIVKSHFKDLHLLTAYALRANSKVSSEFDVLKKAKGRGQTPAEAKVDLLDRALADSAKLGINYWSAVMYETMANSSKFLNSL